jgi:hypothetical protein
VTDIATRAIAIHEAALAACDGDSDRAAVLLAADLAALEARYLLATPPGYERRGLPRGPVTPTQEPEAL